MTLLRAPRLRGLGLRRRVVLSYLAGGVLLSLVSSLLTWSLCAGYLQSQRTRIATAEAVEGALLVQQGLSGRDRLPALLEQVTAPTLEALVRYDGVWYSSSLGLVPGELPADLLAGVRPGRALRQRVAIDGEPRLVVGMALPDAPVLYVAVLSLEELDRTLFALSLVLVGTAVATSVGAGALGVWASRRSLRPLERVSGAAARIAAGDLTARLSTGDPDLRQLSETFNRTADALQARVQRDIRFAGDVSHELRSPLTTMSNAVAALERRRGEMTPTAGEVVQSLAADVARFRRIVADLLEMSVSDGDVDLALESIRLSELVRHACGGKVDPAVLEVDDAGREAVVLGDARRLERVVCNLLENADAHGGGVVRIRVGADETAVTLAVEDAGPGVPLDERTEVFERFHRGRRARSQVDGTGLGLALVAQHVRAHQGEVHVEERPGGGARFVVRLPREPAP